MSKRFCDTELYEKDWFISLEPEQKLFWEYITKKCNNAGIWDVNPVMAKRILGLSKDIDIQGFAKGCNSDGKTRIMVINSGKQIFITTTVKFQLNGTINPKIPAHKGILKQLEEYSEVKEWLDNELLNSSLTLKQELSESSVTLKDKDKDKDNTDISSTTEDRKKREIKIQKQISDPKFQKKDSESSQQLHPYLDELASKFHITHAPHHHLSMRQMNNFLESLGEKDLEEFKKQTEFYFRLKELNNQDICMWRTWILGGNDSGPKWKEADYEGLYVTTRDRKSFSEKPKTFHKNR